MRKSVQILSIGLMVCLALALLGLIGLRVYLATPQFRDLVLSRINPLIAGHIHIGDHQLGLLTGKLTVFKGALTDPGGNRVIEFDQLSVNVQWSALLNQEVVLSAVLVSKPQVMLQRNASGELNLLQALHVIDREQATVREPQQTAAAPPAVRIAMLRIVSARLDYHDPATPLRAQVENLNCRGALDLKAIASSLNLDTGTIQLDTPTVTTQLDGVRLAATLQDARLAISEFSALHGKSSVKISGRIDDFFTRPRLDLAMQAEMRLADVKMLTGSSLDMYGALDLQMKATGTLDNPQALVTLTYGAGHLGDYRIDSAKLKLNLQDRFLTIQAFEIHAAAGRLNGHGTVDAREALPQGLWPFNLLGDRLAYDLNVNDLLVDASRLPLDDEFLTGDIQGHLQLNGRGIDPLQMAMSWSTEIASPNLAGAGMTVPIDLALVHTGRIDQGRIIIDDLTLDSKKMDSNLSLAGNVRMDTREISTRFDLNAPSITGLFALAGVGGVQGSVAVRGNAAGHLARPIISVDLEGKHLAFDAVRIENTECNARLDQDGWLQITQFSLRNKAASIQGQGRMHIFGDAWQVDPDIPLALDLALKSVQVEDIWTQSPAKGRLDGGLKVTGSLTQPQVGVSLTASDMATRFGPMGDAALEMRLQNGRCEIQKLDITNGNAVLGVKGWARLFDPESYQIIKDPEYKLDVKARDFVIADYTDQVSGSVNFETHLKGTVSNPTGQLTLQADNVVLAGQTLDQIELDARVADQKIRIRPLQIRSRTGDEIKAQGWMAFDRSFELAVAADNWPLAEIGLLKHAGDVKGNLRLDFVGHGTLHTPAIEGELHITQLALNDLPFKDIHFSVSVQNQRAHVRATQAFDLDAEYNFASGDFSAAADFDQTQLKPYFLLAGQTGLDGAVSGTVQATGNSNRFKAATAQVNLKRLEIIYEGQALVRTQDFKATLKDKRFVVPASNWSILEAGNLNIQGLGTLEGAIDVAVDGRVPLKAVNPFIDPIYNLGGQVGIHAKVAGQAENPSMNARIQLDNLEGTLPVLSQRMNKLSGSIQISDSKVALEDIRGQIDTGRFDLTGGLELDRWQPGKINLMINADQLPLEIPDTMSLLLSSRLNFKGDQREATMTGEIVLLDGLYYKDVDLNPLRGITTVKRAAPARSVRPEVPCVGHAVLNVAITRRLPFVVDNNLAYLEVSPDLRLRGTLNNPVLSGRAKVDTGEVFYAGNTFVLKRGIVDFLNPYRIAPTLDIHSEVTVRQWLITLLISGSLEEMQIELTSDPPEHHADILSLLVVGQTSTEMRDGTAGASMSASQMMAQLAASTFGDDIRKVTGVDVLEVETPSDQGGESAELVKVTIGKKLTERMTLKYAVSSKQGETVRSTISEYQLMDSIIVSGFQDTKGIYGGELVFRIEFR